MIKFTVCFGKVERHSYKTLSNGHVVDRTYMDKEARTTYPLDVCIEASSKIAADMFDSWLKSFETVPVYTVSYDDAAGILHGRVLIPKCFECTEYNPSIQRSEVLSSARAKAKEVKKAFVA